MSVFVRPNPIGEKVIKATWRRYRDFIIQEDINNMLKRAPKHVDGWGDIDPATKKMTGNYGEKYTGCINEKESLITPENGFKYIQVLEPGVSPLSAIYQRDLEYEKLMNESNEVQG